MKKRTMARNLGEWAERGGVVRQVEEVPKSLVSLPPGLL